MGENWVCSGVLGRKAQQVHGGGVVRAVRRSLAVGRVFSLWVILLDVVPFSVLRGPRFASLSAALCRRSGAVSCSRLRLVVLTRVGGGSLLSLVVYISLPSDALTALFDLGCKGVQPSKAVKMASQFVLSELQKEGTRRGKKARQKPGNPEMEGGATVRRKVHLKRDSTRGRLAGELNGSVAGRTPTVPL